MIGMLSGCGSKRIEGSVGVSHCDRGSIEGEGTAEVATIAFELVLG